MDSFEEEDNCVAMTKRRRLPPDIVKQFLAYFAKNENPNLSERTELSQQTGVDQRTIQIWFQNRRAKLRKESASPALFAEPKCSLSSSSSKSSTSGLLHEGDERQTIGQGPFVSAAPLPDISSKNFKELCLPKYLDVPFDHQQSIEERQQNEAIKQFWREHAALTDTDDHNSVFNSHADLRSEFVVVDEPPPPSSLKRKKSDFYDLNLFESLTPVDMPELTALSSKSASAVPSIPLQHIANSHEHLKLFQDPETKRVYAPQLDPLSTGLDFLFIPPPKSDVCDETASSLMQPQKITPLSNTEPALPADFRFWFPELQF